jgi:phage terminase Nu1 subunit (DNA packaging protein)
MASEAEVPLKTLAGLLNITERRVQQLVVEGVLTRGETRGSYPLRTNMHAYIQFWKDKAIGGDDESGMSEEKLRLVRAQATAQELKNEVQKLEVAPIDLFAVVISSVIVQIVGVLDSIPTKIKRNVPGVSATMIELIKKEIVQTQNIAADVDGVTTKVLNDYFKTIER